jgi:hypothetical protein
VASFFSFLKVNALFKTQFAVSNVGVGLIDKINPKSVA